MATNEINLQLSSLADGGIQEKINKELEKVLDNVMDPNTQATDKRTVTITLTLTPNDNRDAISTNAKITSKLAPQLDVSTTIIAKKDWKSGTLFANELKSSVPGQTYFDDEGFLRADTGQKIEEDEKETVIDFNQRKTNGGK